MISSKQIHNYWKVYSMIKCCKHAYTATFILQAELYIALHRFMFTFQLDCLRHLIYVSYGVVFPPQLPPALLPTWPKDLKDAIWIGHSARTKLPFSRPAARGPDGHPAGSNGQTARAWFRMYQVMFALCELKCANYSDLESVWWWLFIVREFVQL